MKPFSAGWLAAREPHDQRARNPAVLDALAAAVAGLSSIRIVDLGCGTGATLRAIAPRLRVPQHWHCVDNDLGLVERAARLEPPSGVALSTEAVALVQDLAAVLDVWAGAASEEGGLPLAEGVAWRTRRRDLVAAGRSAMHLGHVDFLALPDRNRQH